MALIKAIETESGVTVGYHNVSIFKETTKKQLIAYLNSYADKAARTAGKPPVVEAKRYDIPEEAWCGCGYGIEEAAYTYLKTLPEFDGAEDD